MLLAEFNSRVHVWSRERQSYDSSFDTVFDFGGRRVTALDESTPLVVAGAWARHGVCGYTSSGDLTWQNKSRTNVQYVCPLPDGLVAVSYEAQPTLLLDARSGDQVATLRGVKEVLTLSRDRTLLVETGYVRLASSSCEDRQQRIRLESFALLGAAMDGVSVALAEAGGPLRRVGFDGNEIARYEVLAGRTQAVAHDPSTQTWTAVIHASDTRLVRLNDDFSVLEERTVPHLIDATVLAGDSRLVLVTTDGVVEVDCSNWITTPIPDPA